MSEIECFSGDFILIAPLGTAASLWLLEAGRRQPWPLVIKDQQPQVSFASAVIEKRALPMSKPVANKSTAEEVEANLPAKPSGEAFVIGRLKPK